MAPQDKSSPDKSSLSASGHDTHKQPYQPAPPEAHQAAGVHKCTQQPGLSKESVALQAKEQLNVADTTDLLAQAKVPVPTSRSYKVDREELADSLGRQFSM